MGRPSRSTARRSFPSGASGIGPTALRAAELPEERAEPLRGRCLLSTFCPATFLRPLSRMPKGGLEPPRAVAHCTLNAARLPVPPLRRCRKDSGAGGQGPGNGPKCGFGIWGLGDGVKKHWVDRVVSLLALRFVPPQTSNPKPASQGLYLVTSPPPLPSPQMARAAPDTETEPIA